jgi:hypothetical protein
VNIAIIGGGASGLIVAICASRRGLSVDLFEKSAKVGRKILATGNGRCNITNEYIKVENYHSKNLAFVKEVLKRFNTTEAKKFFSQLGLEMVEGAKGRLYPMSLQSSSVVDFLLYECNRLGVNIHLSSEVQKIDFKGSSFRVLLDEKSKIYDCVVIATGSLAMPTLGSSESGYKFARGFGLEVEKPFASLVQLICNDNKVVGASGVKIDALLEIFVDDKMYKSVRGDLLFTNYGLSGSAILDISRIASYATIENRKVEIKIDLMPDFSLSELKSFLQKRAKHSNNLPLELWLNGVIHKKLIELVLDEARLPHKISINTKVIHKLSFAIKNLRIQVEDTKGVKSCEVMAGGVSTKEINPKTMESNQTKGLFFCGEVLDVDGDCGGYNLHFAWASGYLAGESL